MTQHWKKQASVAYGYSLTRFALNAYMYFEERPLAYETGMEKQQQTDADFMALLKGFLTGSLTLDAVAGFRGRISREMETVIAYTDSFRIYEYALNRVERRFTPEMPVPEWSEDELVDQVMGFLASSGESAVMNRRIQEIIGQLPVRFTRQKYYGMVQEALSLYLGSDKESLDNVMYLLRTASMTELTEEQRHRYPELETLLGRLFGLSFKDLTPEAYREAQQTITLVGEKLFAISESYQTMQELANDLYVLVLTGTDAMRNAAEEEHALKILRGLYGLYERGDREIPEELDEELYFLEGTQEHYYEKYQRMDPAPEYREGEDETAAYSRCVDRLLSTSPFVSLEDKAAAKTVDRKDIEAAWNQYVTDVDGILSSAQKPVARAIMATTLACLPVCFCSLDEIRDYIGNSLASCTDRAEKETCMELLQQLMESEDYALV